MNILSTKTITDCIDGDFMREIRFDQDVTADFIQYLGRVGELQYFPTFARPLYVLNCPQHFIVKGIEGEPIAKITLNRDCVEPSLTRFFEIVDSYGPRS